MAINRTTERKPRGLTKAEAKRELAAGRAVVTLTFKEYFTLRMKANRCERVESWLRDLLASLPKVD